MSKPKDKFKGKDFDKKGKDSYQGRDSKGSNDVGKGYCKHSAALKEVIDKSANDFAWYNNSPQLVKDVANLPYSNMLGTSLNVLDNEATGNSIPGLAVINLFPTLGVCGLRNDPVNVAAQTVYAYVRSYNSGSRNYYSADYFTYLVAITNLYALYSDLVRAYGLCRTYSITNRFYGKAIVDALGYDFDTLTNQLANFRAVINQFAVKINQYAIPKEFNYIDRIAWLPLQVYADANHSKAQLYAFRFSHYYKWNGKAVKTGSALEPIINPTLKGLDEVSELIDTLLGSIRMNEDIGLMSGDTYKAFKGDIRTVAMIPEDVVCVPIFNEGVLAQIHNLKVTGKVTAMSPSIPEGGLDWSDAVLCGWIAQTDEVLVCEPHVYSSTLPIATTPYIIKVANTFNPLMDCGYNDPTPEFNMEASRLISLLGHRSTIDYEENETIIEVSTCGTEIVESVDYWHFNADDNTFEVVASDDQFLYDTNQQAQILKVLGNKAYFDWAPHTYVDENGDENEGPKNVRPYGEIFNYGIMTPSNIDGMHTVAIMSLFNLSNLLVSTRVANK